jgi:hypothetical protein
MAPFQARKSGEQYKKKPSLLRGTAGRYAILTSRLLLVVAVVLGVMTARLGVVFFSVAGMAMGAVGVMRGLLVIAGFVMLGGAVMLGGVLVMFGGLVMMFDGVLAHVRSPVTVEVRLIYRDRLTLC